MKTTARVCRKALLAAALCLGMLTIVPAANSQTPPEGASLSGANAVLGQNFAALVEELKALRAEMAQLRQTMSEMRIPRRPPPPPPPPRVSLDDDPALGRSDAPIAIVEFSEYECPFCLRYQEQTFPKLKASYIETGKVRYVFRDFPLGMHHHAKPAAIAAHCAGRQGAYWPMHDALYANQKRLGPSLYEELAQTLRLDMPVMKACLAASDSAKEVDEDLAYGASVGVEGTPHFFIGRLREGQLVDVRVLSGAQPVAAFERVIDDLLRDGVAPKESASDRPSPQ